MNANPESSDTVADPTESAAATPPAERIGSNSSEDRPARRTSMYYLAAVGAATVGAVVTIAILGEKPASSSAARDGAAPMVSPQTPPARVRAHAPLVFPRWSQAHEDRWISNHPRSVAYEIDANRPVAVWMRRVRPMLVVRCLSKTTDIFVFTDTAARIEPRDDNHTVRIGFDDEADVTERWPDSADHDALFAPDGLVLAQRLARARSMRFAFTPHNADTVVAEFNVTGFDAVASTMSKTCGWH